ncbi:Uncharacterised protein [Mycobacteroides abscessus subsp. abscessus]|nr:Uncharacterised protein [Mycobacteroides abscessus subsp. abscessus]
MPLRMPEAASSPITGIMDPVITPIRELKPYLTQPQAVSGRSASSAASCSLAAALSVPSCLTTAS